MNSLEIEADHDGNCAFDCPQLIESEQAMRFAKPAGIHSSKLLDQHPRGPALNLDFGPE